MKNYIPPYWPRLIDLVTDINAAPNDLLQIENVVVREILTHKSVPVTKIGIICSFACKNCKGTRPAEMSM